MLYENSNSKLVTNMIDGLLDRWISGVRQQIEELIKAGDTESEAYIKAFQTSILPNFVELYFRLTENPVSKEYASVLSAAISIVALEKQRNSHLASTLSISPEALEKERKKYRTEIREKDSENKKKSKEIGKISAAFETPYGKFDTTIKGLVYEEEDNIHIIYDTDRYTLPNMQDLKLVLSATRDDEQIPVMPLVETIQKYACSLSGTERARCQIILDAINQHGMKVSRKELRHILNLKSNLGKQINRFIFEESGVLIGNALKSARNKEALFGGVLGIRHFCKDDAQYYYSGYLGKSINRSFPHACRIRKVCSTGQTLQFQRYLPLLEVDFIRANGWTVIPFPFKYLREWRLQQG